MIRAQTKRIARAVYVFRCGYCGVSEAQCGAELTYDHFRPQSQNGTDDVANLVYACHACNEFKGHYRAWLGDNNKTEFIEALCSNEYQKIEYF